MSNSTNLYEAHGQQRTLATIIVKGTDRVSITPGIRLTNKITDSHDHIFKRPNIICTIEYMLCLNISSQIPTSWSKKPIGKQTVTVYPHCRFKIHPLGLIHTYLGTESSVYVCWCYVKLRCSIRSRG